MTTSPSDHKPTIGVITDRRVLDPHPFHVVGEKYLTAVGSLSQGIPLSIGLLAEPAVAETLSRLDGLLLTGSYSNMEPHHYGSQPITGSEEIRDPHRDDFAIEAIRLVMELDMPLFAICRGFQELNVAYGGTLHQRLGDSGFVIHTEDPKDPLEIQYAPRHRVRFNEGSSLRTLLSVDEAQVNSVHGQGVDRLGEGLTVEAVAEDGLIEAVTVQGARFALGVQWHPEWQAETNPVSVALFKAFGEACRRYGMER